MYPGATLTAAHEDRDKPQAQGIAAEGACPSA
jgi:hypothetical protein